MAEHLEPDCARRLEVDHQLELSRLLDWHLGRIGTFKNAIDEIGSAAPYSDSVGRVARQQTIAGHPS